MTSKTLTTILAIFVIIFFFPVIIGVFGAVFGAVFGVFGAVLGAIFGALGAVFGAVFGAFGSVIGALFDNHWDFGFYHRDIFTIAIIVLVVVLLGRSKKNRPIQENPRKEA
jgi:MFS family permease